MFRPCTALGTPSRPYLGHRAWALMVASALAACGTDSTGPSRNTLHLSARATIDSAGFHTTGQFVLHLIPFDQNGTRFIRDDWGITTTVATPAATAAFDSTAIQPADTQPVAAALLIDDSGSMLNNDPDRQRVVAAREFWNAVLGARPSNLVALLDFGRGLAVPSPGFNVTSMLQAFTADPALLRAAADSLQARPGGGTNMYHATREVVAWVDSTIPSPSHGRALVIITDGRPNDSTFKETLFEETRRTQIPIFAVGVGPASEQSPQADQVRGGRAGAGEPNRWSLPGRERAGTAGAAPAGTREVGG